MSDADWKKTLARKIAGWTHSDVPETTGLAVPVRIYEEIRQAYAAQCVSDEQLQRLLKDFGPMPGYNASAEAYARLVLSALTELQEARKLLQAALPHIRTCPGPTHHEDCACQVKRRIEAMGKGDIE